MAGAEWVGARRTPFPTDRQPQTKAPAGPVSQLSFAFFLSVWN